MSLKFVLLPLLLSFCDASFGSNFAIIGPQTLCPGSVYRAQLTTSYFHQERELHVSIESGSKTIDIQSLKLNGVVDQELSFNIPNDPETKTYKMRAEYANSPDEKIFEKEIKVIRKKYSVFVQTDKAVYRPGDNVHFRVLVLDVDMKPYQFEKMEVKFTDEMKEKVGGRTSLFSESGFYANSLQLSDELNFGKWEIHVKIDSDQNTLTKSFEVKEYRLPPFEVFVEPLKKHALVGSDVVIKVFAKYKFGNGQKLVNGIATVTATAYDMDNKVSFTTTKSDVNLDTQASLRFTEADLKFNLFNLTSVKFKASIVDEILKTRATAESFVTIHKQDQDELKIVSNDEFTPGLSYQLRVMIQNFDGSIKTDRNDEVTLEVQRLLYKDENSPNNKGKYEFKELNHLQKANSLKNGVTHFTIDTPDNSHSLTLGIKYRNTYRVKKVFRIQTKSKQNLELTVAKTSDLKNVKIGVSASTEMKQIFSIVMARSGIAYHQKDEANDKKRFDLVFNRTPQMLPASSLIVYFFNTNGEVIFNQVKLEFEETFTNFLNISVPSTSVEPGSKVTINVYSEIGSYVGLLAVDQKASFLKSGNNIDEAFVADEISSFYFKNVFESNRWDPATLLTRSNAFLLSDFSREDFQAANNMSERKRRHVDDTTTNHIPETWLFKSIQIGQNGRHELIEYIPDEITSYQITGFSIHPKLGISFSKPLQVQASKDFFVDLNIPRSIVEGEVLKVEVFVYNYLKNIQGHTSTTLLTLEIDKNFFEFVKPYKSGGSCFYTTIEENSKSIHSKRNDITMSFFYIRSLKSGTSKLTITARTGGISEVKTKEIEVKVNGQERSHNRVKFIDLRSVRYDGHYFDMSEDDESIIKNSKQAEVSVIGNLMGPALDNIGNLLEHPTETTDQKLLSYMTTAVMLNYMEVTGELEKKEKAIKILEAGYQFVLRRKLRGRDQGAFGQWSGNDQKADIAATAYVTKFLSIIKEWVEIDDSIITGALTYLKNKQLKNGKFDASDESEEASQNGSGDVVFTSFVAICFLENTAYVERYKSTIKKALTFISSKFNNLDDAYGLAIATYALAIGKHENAEKFIDKLITTTKNAIPPYWVGDKQVEIASYAILAYVHLERSVDASDISKWLVTQRNNQGGFSSTRNTYVGIQAISQIARHIYSKDFNLDLYLLTEDPHKSLINVKINKDNRDLLTVHNMPTLEGVSLQANGTGVAYVQVWKKYFTKSKNYTGNFHVDIKRNNNHAKSLLELEVCIKYVKNAEGTSTKTTIAEVSFPSGFEYDDSNSNEILSQGVKKVNTRNDKSIVILFFDQVKLQSSPCFTVRAIRIFDVSVSGPTSVKLFEYDVTPDKSNGSTEQFYSHITPGECVI